MDPTNSCISVIYEFKARARLSTEPSVRDPAEIWRTALDKLGLQHVNLHMEHSLMGSIIWTHLDDFEGKHEELEAEVARSVEEGDIRFLLVTYLDSQRINEIGCAEEVYYEEYWPTIIDVPQEFKD